MRNGKDPAFYGMHLEFLLYCAQRTRKLLFTFYSGILRTQNIPRAFKKCNVIAVLKARKPLLSTAGMTILNTLGTHILENIPPNKLGSTTS